MIFHMCIPLSSHNLCYVLEYEKKKVKMQK